MITNILKFKEIYHDSNNYIFDRIKRRISKKSIKGNIIVNSGIFRRIQYLHVVSGSTYCSKVLSPNDRELYAELDLLMKK